MADSSGGSALAFDARCLDSRNFYTRLGLSRGEATDYTVRNAYRERFMFCMRTSHPSEEKEMWRARASRLNEANEQLNNAQGREAYDQANPSDHEQPVRVRDDYANCEGYVDETNILREMLQSQASELTLGVDVDLQYEKFYIVVDGSSGLPLVQGALYPDYAVEREPTKRGVEFWVLPYRTSDPYQQGPPDRNTGVTYQVGVTYHNAHPLPSISGPTKKELVENVRNLVARHIPNPWLTEQQIEAMVTTRKDLSCWNCAGKHFYKHCFYNCHRCVTLGPWLTHKCTIRMRLSSVPKDLLRALVLQQVWPLGTHPSGQPEFHVDRRPFVYPLDREWCRVFRNICEHFNGRVFIVDSTQYQAWLKRIDEMTAQGGGTVPLPLFLKFPYRQMVLLSVGHALQILDNIYLPVLRSLHRQRYAGPRVELVQRRYFEPQRGDQGRLLMSNMQLRVEVDMTIYDFNPTGNHLHAQLNRCALGTVYYVFEHGAFSVRNNAVEVPRWKHRQELKERHAPKVLPDGSRSIVLTWTNSAQDGAGTIDFRRLIKRKRKKAFEDFKSLSDHMILGDNEKHILLDIFLETAPELLDDGSPSMLALRERVGRMGVDLDLFLSTVYDKSAPNHEGLYEKRAEPSLDLSPFEERHRGRLFALYKRAPDVFGYHDRTALLQQRLSTIGVSIEHFIQLAYFTQSQPFVGHVDFGSEHGLTSYEWVRKIYQRYQDTPAVSLKEIVGGCVRSISESFIGGPPPGDPSRFSAEVWAEDAPRLWRLKPGETIQPVRRAVFRALLQFNPIPKQREAIKGVCTRKVVCVFGPPGSAKTRLLCAAIVYNLYTYGETALILTETNHCADEIARTVDAMLDLLRAQFPHIVAEAEEQFRRTRGQRFVHYVRHRASSNECSENYCSSSRRDSQNPNAVHDALLVISTWGHARSMAIQSFRADCIYADEAARTPLLYPLAVLMQRSLNTTLPTSTMPDDDRGVKEFNGHAANRLILFGDPCQALPRPLSEPIMSKPVAWKAGEYLSLMTVCTMAGCDFYRLTEVFRTPHDAVQFTLDRFHNQHVGAFKDTEGTVLAVKDAPEGTQRVLGFGLPLTGDRLECPDLVQMLSLKGFPQKFGCVCADDTLNLRHLLLRTGHQEDPRRCAKSHGTLLHSHQNPWHRELIMRIVRALLVSGRIRSGERSRPVRPDDILIVTPYRDQTNLIEEDLAQDPLVCTLSDGSVSTGVHCRVLPRKQMIQLHTMATVQGLQSKVVIADFVRHTPSAFLRGHESSVFQTHHNEIYSVGLTRSQVTQISLAVEWSVNRDPEQSRLYEESYVKWQRSNHLDPRASACRQPGDRIPLVDVTGRDVHIRQTVQSPFVDFISDNLWYFWVLSEKYYDYNMRMWRFRDGFHWTRGVGVTTMLPEQEFKDECDLPMCTCRDNGRDADDAFADFDTDGSTLDAVTDDAYDNEEGQIVQATQQSFGFQAADSPSTSGLSGFRS